MVNSPRPMRRPHGRSERLREQVHRAVVDLLAERGPDELTIPLVAERSGVHQATLYRRWGKIAALLQDMVQAGPARTSALPDTGTLRGDLEAYAVGVAGSLAGPLGVLMLRAAVDAIPATADRGPSTVLAERRVQLGEMLGRARDRGESPPAVADLLEVVVAPLYFRALFDRPASAQDARQLVDRLLGDYSSPR
ncbi:TetR/AcrR family transcriptional regulator [Actinoplanes sp. NPDC051513]|uniref:TetR/AcrR family transcriptional regulator n=1 Tax=Actinoplanes sp. NPDC051513 TaxID=3363908 RepID=UPI0037BA8AB9